jgi:hypothetical protein
LRGRVQILRRGARRRDGRLLHDKDAAKSQRDMQAMMKMDKIDIAGLEQAHAHA